MRKFPFIILSLLLTVFSCTKKENSNEKVLQIRTIAKIKGLDPIMADDRYSANEIGRVYEGLLEYHYLKRPMTLVPNLAEAMPEVSPDGLMYTFKLRKGVLFHDDKCFPNGKGREMKAEDFVYSFKRVADPKLQSTGWWVLDGKLVGLNEWREKNAAKDKTDYSETIEGMKALDDYTLQFKLKKPFPQFLNGMVQPFHYVVAKEAVEMYGKEFLNHPVGTGPFILKEFTQTNTIEYFKNPTFREKLYPSEAAEEYKQMGYLADAGKRLPFADRVVVNIMVETQPAWLSFSKGKIDFVEIPKDNYDQAIGADKKMKKEFVDKEVSLQIHPSFDITLSTINMEHPLFKDNLKLRQALASAMDQVKLNELFYYGMAIPAQSVMPPGLPGYDPNYKNPYFQNDKALAKKLLAEAGYPDGKGLPEIVYDTSNSTANRQIGEFMEKELKEIGVKLKVVTNPWPDLQKKLRTKNNMMGGYAWGADYPDGENFLQLFYGPHKSPGANASNYDNAEYNALFEKASVMQDSPERTALYEKLNKMIAERVPALWGVHRVHLFLNHKWLKNFVVTDFEWGREQFINVDMEEKNKLIKKF